MIFHGMNVCFIKRGKNMLHRILYYIQMYMQTETVTVLVLAVYESFSRHVSSFCGVVSVP